MKYRDPEYPTGLDEAMFLAKSGNDMKDIPVAACPRCGGWTSQGGMSQHALSAVPVQGRTGCTCHGALELKGAYVKESVEAFLKGLKDLESQLHGAGSAVGWLQKSGELDDNDKKKLGFIRDKIEDCLSLTAKMK